MFQFNKHLCFFAIILLQLSGVLTEKFNDDSLKLKDYAVVYDQRQSGTYNFNVKVAGLVVHLPTETPETPAPVLPTFQIPNLLDGVLGGNSDQLSNFFNWKKKDLNEDPIPSTYNEDAKHSPNLVRAQRRLYN